MHLPTSPNNIKMVLPLSNNDKPTGNSETYFFRDHGQFDLLRRCILPEIIDRHRLKKTLRFWSAGCASGEEAYSLAMVLDMLLPKRDGWNILIIGSDINPAMLTKARIARYGRWSFRMVPDGIQQRYFEQKGSEWQLEESIKRMVDFRLIDLIETPFPQGELCDMDLILCRNVFIYFDVDTVSAVANKLANAICDGGYLITAHAELGGIDLDGMRSRLFTESVVYQRSSTDAVKTLDAIRSEPCITPIATASFTHYSLPKNADTKYAPVSTLPRTQTEPNIDDDLATAKHYADRGEYDEAERICHQILDRAPLAAPVQFLLAQLAQLRGEFEIAESLLTKTLYLDPNCVAATLELAALYERRKKTSKALTLRRTALDIVQALPADTNIEPYDMTAKEIAQWLSQ